MKTLLLMRHAKSSWDDDRLADHNRPLSKRGKNDAPRMGRLLKELQLVPDLVLSSTAVRAQKTAEAVVDACGCVETLQSFPEIYEDGMEGMLEILRTLPPEYEIVLVIGHNPDVELLVSELTGESVRMPTAAIARVDLSLQSWHALTEVTPGKLTGYWTPRQEA